MSLATGLALASPAIVSEGVVVKQVFEMGPYTTVGGETIEDVRVGWEAYGELNEARDSAVVITLYFLGVSHSAGRYSEDGPRGYWDYLIGPALPLDTDRYDVLSADTLVDLDTGDRNVTATGPPSVDPATGEPYAFDFPSSPSVTSSTCRRRFWTASASSGCPR